MPVYKYRCDDCKKVTELICSYSDKSAYEKKLDCEFCKSKNMIPVFAINISSGSGKDGPDDMPHSCGGSCGSCGGGCN